MKARADGSASELVESTGVGRGMVGSGRGGKALSLSSLPSSSSSCMVYDEEDDFFDKRRNSFSEEQGEQDLLCEHGLEDDEDEIAHCGNMSDGSEHTCLSLKVNRDYDNFSRRDCIEDVFEGDDENPVLEEEDVNAVEEAPALAPSTSPIQARARQADGYPGSAGAVHALTFFPTALSGSSSSMAPSSSSVGLPSSSSSFSASSSSACFALGGFVGLSDAPSLLWDQRRRGEDGRSSRGGMVLAGSHGQMEYDGSDSDDSRSVATSLFVEVGNCMLSVWYTYTFFPSEKKS